MINQKFEPYKRMLELRRKEILQTLSKANAERLVAPSDAPKDVGDQSALNFSREFSFQQNSHNRQLLRRIEAALERIRVGSFGECAACGDQINGRRLEAMPFATYCRECQERLERNRGAEQKSA